jgi:hypothetical protein
MRQHHVQEELWRLLAELPLDERSIWDKLERASQPLVILFIAADPKDAEHLSDSKETGVSTFLASWQLCRRQSMRRSCASHLQSGLFRADVCPNLATICPVVLHFSGHGTERGFEFRNDKGGVAEIHPQTFAKLLAKLARGGLEVWS